MAPKVERVPPPFMQIVESFREQIQRGALVQGAQLPPIPAIAREAGVASATAAKAVRQLQREGFVRTSNQGTFVDLGSRLTSGSDRLHMLRAIGNGLRPGERVDVVGAEVMRAPSDVATVLAVAEGGEVVRRRRVYRDEAGVVAVSTSWLPGAFAGVAPELLSSGPLPKMTFGLIEERTGRRASRRSDEVTLQPVPTDVAVHLGVEAGTQALVMTNRYWDQHGDPIEYAVDFLSAGRKLSAECDM
ncbi:GntR family transcriptional regulator [Streptomyces sp. NPDC058947]|uniref:GntR family transcriptional regulator n=1 Tax=Streptomyces sp. NPDC058947 TaxID=3346675 RepID=UPI0036B0155D